MYKIILKLIMCSSFLFSFNLFSNEEKTASAQTETLSSIKDVIKNDMLADELANKKQVEEKAKERIQEAKKAEYKVPSANELQGVLTEVWVAKNVSKLKWDYQHPQYGLEESFAKFLSDLGMHEIKFRILLINTPVVTHFALPGGDKTAIFLLSGPFIQAMDLTKLEISILLFEDFQRLKFGYFENFIKDKNKALFELAGKNFYENKLTPETMVQAFKSMDEFVFQTGFDFSAQFKVTQSVSDLLKSDLRVWGQYLNLMKKIDILVTTNFLYKDYSKIYPSPQMQIKWLSPEVK